MRLNRIVIPFLLAGSLCFGQEPAKKDEASQVSKFYKVLFTVKELQGTKVESSREYTVTVATNKAQFAQVRAGEKLPYGTSGGASSYQDVGTNIDCHDVKQEGDRISMSVSGEVTSVAANTEPGKLPLIKQTRWGSYVLLPLRKTTTVFLSDEPTASGRMEMDALVTPIE